MNDAAKLGFGEFLADIKFTITSPAKRFALIHERGAMWGSLLLLLTPFYLSLSWCGGIYFDHDPFPGYSFLLPVLVAAVLVFIRIFLIHLFARLFERKQDPALRRGGIRELTTLFGYAGLPDVLAMFVALTLFLLIPEQLSVLFRDYEPVAISILVAFGIALFVWHLILMVLAMRLVYPLRDLYIVLALILGIVLSAGSGIGMRLITRAIKADFSYLQPIMQPKVLRFHTAGPASPARETKVETYVDVLVYRLKNPKRFEVVAWVKELARSSKGDSAGGKMSGGVSMEKMLHEGEKAIGRILGVPGDTVQYEANMLVVNGQRWAEPYITPEFEAKLDSPARQLGSSEYLILPENRHLIAGPVNEWVFGRERIIGRVILRKWPLGWWWFRPSVFLPAHPQ
jgi:hypothetical protein